MNLQQLRYLVSAADSGSVSGAARTHMVSQPVVSRALHDLERDYGVTLFRRSGRNLVLTEAGDQVVASAREALHAVAEVDRTARELALGAELVVVATPTNSALLTPVVTSFVRYDPGVGLRLRRSASMGEVLGMVSGGQAELGFGDLHDGLGGAALAIDPLWESEVVIVSPPGSPLPPTVRLADAANSGLVLPPEGSERRRMIDEFLVHTGGRRRHPALVTDERSAWIASAQQGIGSFISYRAVASDLNGVELRSFDPPHRVTVGFVHRPGGLSGAGKEMLQMAKDCPPPPGCRTL